MGWNEHGKERGGKIFTLPSFTCPFYSPPLLPWHGHFISIQQKGPIQQTHPHIIQQRDVPIQQRDSRKPIQQRNSHICCPSASINSPTEEILAQHYRNHAATSTTIKFNTTSTYNQWAGHHQQKFPQTPLSLHHHHITNPVPEHTQYRYALLVSLSSGFRVYGVLYHWSRDDWLPAHPLVKQRR